MKEAFLLFLKRPTTKTGLITALMCQIIFSVIWMTGYAGVTERTTKLHIAVANEDQQLGKQVVEQTLSELPFETVELADIQEAQFMLDSRELQMIVHIPAGFTEKAADGSARIEYWINESNPALIKSTMSAVANELTNEINHAAAGTGVQALLNGSELTAEQSVPAEASLSERITTDIRSIHAVDGMNNQMVPMMMVLASFVGAMIMGLNFEQSTLALRAQLGRWRIFAIKAVINVAAAVLCALVGATLVATLGGQIEHGFVSLWLFQSLFLLAFMFVSQMSLAIFGLTGMLFNILLLSSQLVSSGTIVPRELLPDFYIHLGSILPATYAVAGNMNILFGGSGIGGECLALVLITVVAIAITSLALWLKKGPAVQAKPAQMAAARD